MAALRSFAPIAAPDARILILGSMPGAASLAAGQYYAHPRNAFWPIMGALVGAGPALAYAGRQERLRAAGIALWDVLASCAREGSLDAAIRDAELNDFPSFFAAHPAIRTIFFNGAKAEAVFRRQVLPGLHPAPRGASALVRLPSTSPAYASLGAAAKLRAWRRVTESLAAPAAADG